MTPGARFYTRVLFHARDKTCTHCGPDIQSNTLILTFMRMQTTIGGLAGLRVRMDVRAGNKTRIEIVSDGTFSAMLAEDPELKCATLPVLVCCCRVFAACECLCLFLSRIGR